jgi:hypothetical protein
MKLILKYQLNISLSELFNCLLIWANFFLFPIFYFLFLNSLFNLQFLIFVTIIHCQNILINSTQRHNFSKQNGLAKCKNHHIREMGLSLLATSHLPPPFRLMHFSLRSIYIYIYIYIINRLPMPTLIGSCFTIHALSCLIKH